MRQYLNFISKKSLKKFTINKADGKLYNTVLTKYLSSSLIINYKIFECKVVPRRNRCLCILRNYFLEFHSLDKYNQHPSIGIRQDSKHLL